MSKPLSENMYVVVFGTAIGTGTVAALVTTVLVDAVITGAYLGAALPLFVMGPFLACGLLLPREYQGVMRGWLFAHFAAAWIHFILYVLVADTLAWRFPESPSERELTLWIVLAYSLALVLIARVGPLKVVWRWRSCRANWFAMYGAIAGYTPLRGISARCVSERRPPTPEEYARLVDEIVSVAAQGRYPVSEAALEDLARRDRIYAERTRAATEALHATIAHIDTVVAHAGAREFERAVIARIADQRVKANGGAA